MCSNGTLDHERLEAMGLTRVGIPQVVLGLVSEAPHL